MQHEERKDPGEAAGDGNALHGSRTEVNWNEGQGAQPYANRGPQEHGPGAAAEAEAGDRGDASGRNLEQLEAAKGTPGLPLQESRRER